jgi:phospholipid/cholesterol/gamma-HCH transport system ATP-binding protein
MIVRSSSIKPGKETVIEARRLKKSFDELRVLDGLDFHLSKKENLVVLGKSGTGKSVLIKCLVGLIRPDEGELTVLGKNVTGLEHNDLLELRKKVGFLFQGGALYDSMSVRENLEFPLKRQHKKLSKGEINDAVLEALENVGLVEAIDKMPSELSGGMKKRVALARTLILKPAIMLYDEPTTGLDPVTAKEISELIVEMQQKFDISSVIITHDMPCARITGNRICLLRKGKFQCEGSYEELESSDDEWVRAFFE